MSEDGTTLYWADSVGNNLSSTMSSSTQVSVTSTATANVDGSDAGVAGPCDLTSTTALTLTLASGSPPNTFTGSISYTFAAATGVSTNNNCTDQLSASGGPYSTLPCSATFALAGAHQ